ncbi:uncharacterized protein LOC141615108 [Silene latifolia]|uniref:uncharacterized protein LOC141615108 n=1 Tax=Silene latifolia TaxID=37657 RepID=UPI003D76B7D3
MLIKPRDFASESRIYIHAMKNYNFSPLACWQPLNPGLDEFHSTNPADVSMMAGNSFNGYLEGGFNEDSSYQHCYGSVDVPSPFLNFSPAMNSSLISAIPTENLSFGTPTSLVDYQWSLPCEPTKSDSLYVQSCKPTIKDVRKSVNGARLGQKSSGLGNQTSLEASRMSRKRKAIEQLINAQKLKVPGKRSQKLSDKITALQELVSPWGKTDTSSVLQEACLYIKIIHQEIRRLSISYFEGLSLQVRLQGEAEKQGELQSRGLCLVPVSIMKKLTRESWGDQHQNATRNIRRP